MKRTIHKIFWLWEFDKEEKWLNEMSAKGLQLSSVGFCKYTFDLGSPNEYTYRLEMLEHWPSHPESEKYIEFIEDTGAEHICTLSCWAYFRKKSNESGFDLFSDIDSRIRHLNKILILAGVFLGLNFVNGISSICRFFDATRDGNLIIGILCMSVALFIGYGFLRLFLKRSKLKKEKILRE